MSSSEAIGLESEQNVRNFEKGNSMKLNGVESKRYEQQDEKRENYRHYTLLNKERLRDSKRLYTLRNRNEKKEYNRQYELKNKDKIRTTKCEYRLENSNRLREYQLRYRLRNHKNPESYVPRNIVRKSWKSPESVREYFESVAKRLFISAHTDWYRISSDQIRELGGVLI
jgi:hypothetical protein